MAMTLIDIEQTRWFEEAKAHEWFTSRCEVSTIVHPLFSVSVLFPLPLSHDLSLSLFRSDNPILLTTECISNSEWEQDSSWPIRREFGERVARSLLYLARFYTEIWRNGEKSIVFATLSSFVLVLTTFHFFPLHQSISPPLFPLFSPPSKNRFPFPQFTPPLPRRNKTRKMRKTWDKLRPFSNGKRRRRRCDWMRWRWWRASEKRWWKWRSNWWNIRGLWQWRWEGGGKGEVVRKKTQDEGAIVM